ncbi:MAG: hypothetical protein NT018_00960 [Armatimonadetes bacterium]|nr:hypothetical protein [Armatimonadota bacterium]
MESSDGQTAVSEIAKRAKTAEDRMREAQSIDAQPVYQIALWT